MQSIPHALNAFRQALATSMASFAEASEITAGTVVSSRMLFL